MRNERIDRAKKVLLVNLHAITESTMGASAYVLTASDTHEWVPIEGPLTPAAAADLIREAKAQFGLHPHSKTGERRWLDGRVTDWPDALVDDLERELHARGVTFVPVEPQS